jgi:hypothetical protein
MYFEDLNRAPNKEFGPKDIFEIASINAIFCVSWVSKFFCLAKKTRYSSNSKAN